MRAALAFSLLLLACAEDPGKDKPKATVADAPPMEPARNVEPAKAPAGPTVTLAVDAARSKIEALGAKITATHPINFPVFQGKVALTGADISAVSFEVDMNALVADAEKLTTHLKNEDFFDVAKFPTATFQSNAVTAGASEPGATHTVSGDLSLHGVTKRISFPAKLKIEGTEVTANSEFVLNRKDFGIVYAGKADDLIQDNVRMTIAFAATAPGAAAPTGTAAPAAAAPAAPAAPAH
jgi:polyisoprenoid-binding protein YceI